MFEREYELMYEVEESHWWFVTKRKIVFDIMKKRLASCSSTPRILDVGLGTGIVLAGHSEIGEAYGVELSPHAIRQAVKRKINARIAMGTAASLPFADGSFDAVTVLDVLYHKNISSDAGVLSEIFRVLKPGGFVVMTDSAMMCLWGKHDIVMEAARRYDRAGLKKIFEEAGFTVPKISYMNFFLFPVVYLKRKIGALLPGEAKSDVGKVGALANAALSAVYGSEKYLLRYMNLPVGSSIIAVGVRPE